MFGITENLLLRYLLWILYMTTLVTIAALIVRKISPQAAGSGVGEMKVVLKGVVLKGNLTHISKSNFSRYKDFLMHYLNASHEAIISQI